MTILKRLIEQNKHGNNRSHYLFLKTNVCICIVFLQQKYSHELNLLKINNSIMYLLYMLWYNEIVLIFEYVYHKNVSQIQTLRI